MAASRTSADDLLDLDAMADAAECLRTIAHPLRLRMIQMLLRGERTVGELADACGIPSHAASGHLRILRDRGLLGVDRRGRTAHYYVVEDGLASIMRCVEKRFG